MTEAWIFVLALVSLAAITGGLLVLAWSRRRLGLASFVAFVAALVVWITAFAAVSSGYRDADGFVDCGESCTERPPRGEPRVRRAAAPHLRLGGRDARRPGRPCPPQARARLSQNRASMAHSFKLPDLGEGLTEGEVARWLVAEGAVVAEDDPLVEIQTDKATVEIPSPYAGTVLRILVSEGEVAPVGAVLVVIGEPGEAVSEDAPVAPAPSAPPRARRGLPRRRSCERSPPTSDRSRVGDRVRSRRADHRGGRACRRAAGTTARVAESPSAAFVA